MAFRDDSMVAPVAETPNRQFQNGGAQPSTRKLKAQPASISINNNKGKLGIEGIDIIYENHYEIAISNSYKIKNHRFYL